MPLKSALSRGRGKPLIGRAAECSELDSLLEALRRPLVCLVDDEHWLDRASAQVLAFVARRLGMESVGLIFSARVRAGELTIALT
jgi:hypothetical protein